MSCGACGEKSQEQGSQIERLVRERFAPLAAEMGLRISRYQYKASVLEIEMCPEQEARGAVPGSNHPIFDTQPAYPYRAAWRSPSGYEHAPGTTAGDVVRYEQDELGNPLGISDDVIAALDGVPADYLIWVARTKKAAEHYGGPRPFQLGPHAVVIAEDGDDGYLVLNR